MNDPLCTNAYYGSSTTDFLAAAPEAVLGRIAENTEFDIELTQRHAWLQQIEVLKDTLRGIDGTVFLEFVVPRLGSRIDAVLVAGPIVFVIEFKVGREHFTRDDYNQVWDYALDLKNFHQATHKAAVIPLLVATAADHSDSELGQPHRDRVFRPAVCNVAGLSQLIRRGIATIGGPSIDGTAWGRASYLPTPTIIEAARALYAQHSVADIARHDAGAKNLRLTSQRVEVVIEEARRTMTKAIVFVTGVPGAGKTLVGLNVATHRRDKADPTHAVYLSGNGPLVAVLREALKRDAYQRLGDSATRQRKAEIVQEIKAFIQNVHNFRDTGLRTDDPPPDHVVIFDEAQRAWNRAKTADFMKRKKARPGFQQSEPEFLISYLDRRQDWAVIVCLVGGGQEIYQGEAGISEWLDALRLGFPDWSVYVSPELSDTEYAAGAALKKLEGRANVMTDDALHLAVSMRSFRAENVSLFVKAVLDCERDKASNVLAKLLSRYPIAITRDLRRAKEWIREHARGSERCGLVASSGALRLKPEAIDIRVKVNPVTYFLNGPEDTRSSFYLEDAATEFQVQGLELDWTCVTWDADLRFTPEGWDYKSFRGTQWDNVRKPTRKQYLLNAYRVLLTRARQGMVICVPEGDERDPTRSPEYYDATFDYLTEIGIPTLTR